MEPLNSHSALRRFDPIFLLWVDGESGDTAIRELSKKLTDSPDPEGDLSALLSEANWRCHLTAAVALVISHKPVNPRLVDSLWEALDAGSWVSPQLAACLSYLAPDFSSQAKKRIEKGCPVVPRYSPTVDGGQLGERNRMGLGRTIVKSIKAFLKSQPVLQSLGDEAARRHVEQGPDGSAERSAKSMGALLYLCSLRPDCDLWVKHYRTERFTQRLLALDLHRGDRIAEVWNIQFERALSAYQSNSAET
jgi:hypothetical protein